ncbi:MAG: GAF domain-containing protein [Spirochaetales bacterium]|nr:GAF domain-containing protein [Spirochaetales bacterium]
MQERKPFFLKRILELLQADLGSAPLSCEFEDGSLFELGSVAPPLYTVPFLGKNLTIARHPAEITPQEKIAIGSAEKLARLLLSRLKESPHPRPGEVGAFSLPHFLAALHELFKTMQSRAILLDNYEKIIQLNQQILLADDLISALQVIMDMAKTTLGGEGSSLLLVDARTGEMYFNVISGEHESQLKEIRIPSGQGIAGSVVATARPEIIRSVQDDPRAFHNVDTTLGKTTRDMMIAPIIARGQVIGVIEVINSLSPHGFMAEDLEFLSNIASHTSLLIENARSKQDLLRTNRELDHKIMEVQALYEAGKVLSSSLDLPSIKKNILRSLMRILKIGRGAILQPSYGTTVMIEHELSLTADGFKESTLGGNFQEAADVLTWLVANKEPVYLKRSESGMVQRFLNSNQRLAEMGFAELWLPVFSPHDNALSFIIALGQLEGEPGLPFLQSVMAQAESALRNIESYHQALVATEKENHVRKTFQKYVPDRVVQEVLEETEARGPAIQQIAVLFADIPAFTALAEKTAPALLVELLNEFFEEMVGIVNVRGGIVDKFMGDSLMALFGVPESSSEDTAHAVLCAMDMQQALSALNGRRREKGRPEFGLCIGVHCGPALVGNMGASQRLDFTAIGDSVNLASRLEKLNRLYGTSILLSFEAVAGSGLPNLPIREIDQVYLRGKSKPTRVFAPAKEGPAHVADFLEGMAAFRAGNFPDALRFFEKEPEHRINQLFIERCRRFISDPPANWNGVFALPVV